MDLTECLSAVNSLPAPPQSRRQHAFDLVNEPVQDHLTIENWLTTLNWSRLVICSIYFKIKSEIMHWSRWLYLPLKLRKLQLEIIASNDFNFNFYTLRSGSWVRLNRNSYALTNFMFGTCKNIVRFRHWLSAKWTSVIKNYILSTWYFCYCVYIFLVRLSVKGRNETNNK